MTRRSGRLCSVIDAPRLLLAVMMRDAQLRSGKQKSHNSSGLSMSLTRPSHGLRLWAVLCGAWDSPAPRLQAFRWRVESKQVGVFWRSD
jgi:hypothetical protein